MLLPRNLGSISGPRPASFIVFAVFSFNMATLRPWQACSAAGTARNFRLPNEDREDPLAVAMALFVAWIRAARSGARRASGKSGRLFRIYGKCR
jgi:hypothetical protein